MPYCSLCKKQVNQLHYDIEKWILDTIIREHPDWVDKDGSCQRCINYYESLDKIKTN